jgi:nucleoside 2-deoxyribosyltransferase
LKRFYVASSFKNVENVRYVAQNLESKGYVNTYDWTRNAKALNEKTFTFEDLMDIGQKERDALLNADVVVILLPGGKGTHVEMGIAIGHAKRIIRHSPDEAINNFETTSTFYHLPEVEKCYGTLDELLGKITGRELAETAR